jgi:hypothetical protein
MTSMFLMSMGMGLMELLAAPDDGCGIARLQTVCVHNRIPGRRKSYLDRDLGISNRTRSNVVLFGKAK